MKVECDFCKKDFELVPKMIKEKYLGAMILERVFNCPYCKHKYLISIENGHYRRMAEEINECIKRKDYIAATRLTIFRENYLRKINGMK